MRLYAFVHFSYARAAAVGPAVGAFYYHAAGSQYML